VRGAERSGPGWVYQQQDADLHLHLRPPLRQRPTGALHSVERGEAVPRLDPVQLPDQRQDRPDGGSAGFLPLGEMHWPP